MRKRIEDKARVSRRNSIGNSTSRADRIFKRNRVIVARWYYWTECRRMRTDDAIRRLCDEFFCEARTITNAIHDGEGYLRDLIKERPSWRKLRYIHESFVWTW